jgi:uncharacterized membrane protein YfcA
MEVGTWGFTVAGLVVGFIVGMTGVGGGSLMTPILLWFGINPATAVGTDLLYAAITKASGVWVHGRNKNIDWKITGWLALGSVPAAAIVLLYLKSLNAEPQAMGAVIKQALAAVLFLTAMAILFKKRLQALASRHAGDRYNLSPRTLNGLTLVAGMGHASMGNMDWSLLGHLLLGSLPGIYLGSHLSGRVPDDVLRPLLAVMLLLIGYKLAF